MGMLTGYAEMTSAAVTGKKRNAKQMFELNSVLIEDFRQFNRFGRLYTDFNQSDGRFCACVCSIYLLFIYDLPRAWTRRRVSRTAVYSWPTMMIATIIAR
jgi:hypothetical protein